MGCAGSKQDQSGAVLARYSTGASGQRLDVAAPRGAPQDPQNGQAARQNQQQQPRSSPASPQPRAPPALIPAEQISQPALAAQPALGDQKKKSDVGNTSASSSSSTATTAKTADPRPQPAIPATKEPSIIANKATNLLPAVAPQAPKATAVPDRAPSPRLPLKADKARITTTPVTAPGTASPHQLKPSASRVVKKNSSVACGDMV